MDGDTPGRAELLRRHGLQVTAQRIAVLEAVARHPHATAEEIEHAVRADIGAISRQAIYDALSALTERGLLRRIQPARSVARYETRVDDNHHHLVCRGCGCVVDVECALGAAPCLDAADDHGFRIDEAEVIYWGWCPQCDAPGNPERAAAKHATPRPSRRRPQGAEPSQR